MVHPTKGHRTRGRPPPDGIGFGWHPERQSFAIVIGKLYDRLVVPRLVHWGMRSERLQPLRAATVATASGRVLEIGIGSGLNFPFYGRDVEEVVGIDPAKPLLTRAGKAGGWMPYKIRLICQSAEYLPYPDQSFDSVVSTWSLCSIPDVEAALAEAYRVLRPGGRFVFVEHGAAPGAGICRWQRRLTPAWRCLAGGCHLDRRPDRLLEQAGFTLETLETGHLLDGPRLVTFHYRGVAIAGGRPAAAPDKAGVSPLPSTGGGAIVRR